MRAGEGQTTHLTMVDRDAVSLPPSEIRWRAWRKVLRCRNLNGAAIAHSFGVRD